MEAMKLAFADVERHVADPDAMRIGTGALLDPAYLAGRAALIDRTRASEPAAGAPTAGGTVYLPAAAASGMMLSSIQPNSGERQRVVVGKSVSVRVEHGG